MAGENGVTRSPVFILYRDGELVKSRVGFLNEQGEGLEDFLGNHVAQCVCKLFSHFSQNFDNIDQELVCSRRVNEESTIK